MSDLQVWVRNDKGQVYGPLTPPSVELLIDNGVIGGRMQVSTDGVNYVFPGRVPGLRMIFPRDTWGEVIVPGDELDAQWGQVVMPASIHGQAASSGGIPSSAPAGGPVGIPAGGPVAGPGARGGPTAGPGTRPQPGRPMNPAQFGAQGRGPPVMSSPSGIGGPPMMASAGPIPSSSLSGINSALRPSSPSIADFINAPIPSAPRSSPSGVISAPAPSAPPRAAPSVADFLNAAEPAAPVRATTPGVAAVPPARPVMRPEPSAPRSVPTSSSGSGVRAAPPMPSDLPADFQMPPAGVLGEISPQQLYYFAASTDVTGLLTVKLADRELVVHFKKGNPEFLDSTHPEDSLDTFLVAQKLATPAQIQTAQSQGARFGGELLPALFGLGLLNPNAVFQHLGQRASLLLLRVLTAEQGTFAFDHEELAPSRAMPMGNRWAVYLEALRRVPGPDLRRRLMSALELPVMRASGRVPVADLRLTPQETRAHHYFDGVRSLAQLIKDLPAESDNILRTAWMLAPFELVSFAGVSPTAPHASAAPAPARPAAVAAAPKAPVVAPPKPNPPAPAPAPAPAAAPARVPGPPVMSPQSGAPAARPVTAPGNPAQMPKPAMPYPGGSPEAPAPRAPPVMAPALQRPPPVMKPAAPTITAAAPDADARQLQATYELMKKQNHFEVLGLKKEADAGAIKIAYLKAARSYHPDTVAPGSPEAVARLKADIFARISEANAVLSDPKRLEEYVGELNAGGTGNKVDIEKILRAEEVFQKGRILIQARKYPDALKLFEEAVTCNAEEGEFYAWRGYAKFLCSTDKKLVNSDVMRDLNLCIAKNPNVAATYYFLGFIAKHHGDEKNALANFRKCVALDPKHIDAQREVRTMMGKK